MEVLVKLVRVGPRGEERPAVLGADRCWFDISEVGADLEISGLGRQRRTVGQA